MDNIVEVILRVRDQASAALAQVQRAAGDVRRSLSEVQRGLEGLGSSLGAILGTGGLAYALSSAARAAQEAESSMRVLANTARAVGVDYDQLSRALNQVLEPLGVLPEQAASAAAQLLRAGFTTEQITAAFQAGAASALAAGKTAAQGIENVAMALSTGQSVYLNYIGIAENIGSVINKVASSMKGASEEAIRQAQNQAALNVILRATAQEVASLPDLLTGLTGATNRFNLELYQLRVTIGQQVRPVLTALYQVGADLLGLFRNLDPAVRQSIATWAMATTATTGLATAVGALLPVVRNAATVVMGLGRTLLWLVTSPIGLVVGGVALLAREWINMSGSAEDARRKLHILGQALWGLAEVARGVVQAMAGLLSNLGNGLAAIARAFLRVVQGDFTGAWREIQNSWNLEAWAARFTAANESIRKGLALMGSSLRGEVRPEVERTGKAIEDLVARWQAFFTAAQRQGDVAAPKLPPLPGLDAGAGAGAEKLEKTKNAAEQLRDSLTALRQLYEIGRISAEQYAQGLQLIYDRALELERRFPQLASALRDVALDARKGLEDLRRAAEEEGKRISDALLRLAQDIAAARAESWARAWEASFPPPERLRERLAELQRLFELGRISQDEFAQGLVEIYAQARRLEPMFPQLAAGYQDLQLAVQSALRSIRRETQDLPDWETATSGLKTFLEGVPAVAQGAVEAVQSLIGVLGADELEQVIQTNIAFLLDLQRQVPAGTAAYLALDAAIAKLRQTYLELYPVVRATNEEIFIPAGNWYDVVAGAKQYKEELAKLLQEYQNGAISHSEFNKKLSELLADLQGILPVWEEWVDEQERAGVNMTAAREALAVLNNELAVLGIRINSIEREKFQWLFDPLAGLDTTPSGLQTFLQGVPDVARGTVEAVRSLVEQLGADDLREVLETNIAFLVDLQQRVPEGTDAYRALSAAIAELRLEYLRLFPAVQVVEEEVLTPAENYYDVVAGAKAYREELEELLSALEKGAISQEEFNEKFAQLLDDLQGILPVWEEWLEGLEAKGVNTESARQALALLNTELAKTPERIRAIERTRLDRWLSDLTSAIQTATNAISGMLDAFNAQTFGSGLTQFARGLGDLLGLIPGGGLIGGLVSAVGGLLGRIWDGIASVFDSGWRKVQERLRNAVSRFTLISTDAFAGAIERYQERYLFGLIRVTKYRINETFLALAQSIASALEGGVLNGIKRAATAFLRGAVEWAELLRQGIREAIEAAVIEAVIRGAVIKGALGKLLDQLVAALASGDYSLAQGVVRQIAAAIPGLVSALEGVLTPFRNALESAFPSDLTGPGVRAIQYQLPTVSMGAPAWVSEMGRHVERFGLYVEDLVERGIRVQVVGTDWILREVAV
jgi:hypothetical protein